MMRLFKRWFLQEVLKREMDAGMFDESDEENKIWRHEWIKFQHEIVSTDHLNPQLKAKNEIFSQFNRFFYSKEFIL